MIHVSIPMPPPLSALTTNRKGGGRCSTERYRIWALAAGHDLNRAKCKPVQGPVDIRLSLEPPRNKDGSIPKTKNDCSNRIKAVEDLLVSHGLIVDDGYPFVMSTQAEWVEGVKGCVVAVFPREAE